MEKISFDSLILGIEELKNSDLLPLVLVLKKYEKQIEVFYFGIYEGVPLIEVYIHAEKTTHILKSNPKSHFCFGSLIIRTPNELISLLKLMKL